MHSILNDDGVRLIRVQGVDALVEAHLEVLAELLAQGGLDGLEDVGEDAEVGRVVLVVVAALEDTGAHQARVPAVHVAADDVRGRVVADHVDVLGQPLLAVQLVHPAGHDLVGVLVRGQLGLAVHDTLQVDAGQGAVHGLEADAEGSLGHAGGGVLRGAQKVTLGEVDGDALGDGVLGPGVEAAVLGLQQVHDNLHVSRVVAAVAEDEDGLDVDLGEVPGARGGPLSVSEDPVGGDGRVPADNVVGHDNVLEAVLLRDLAALVALATDDQDGLVVLGQGRHGCVGLDELVGVDGLAEDLAELLAAGLLGLARTVGKAVSRCQQLCQDGGKLVAEDVGANTYKM